MLLCCSLLKFRLVVKQCNVYIRSGTRTFWLSAGTLLSGFLFHCLGMMETGEIQKVFPGLCKGMVVTLLKYMLQPTTPLSAIV